MSTSLLPPAFADLEPFAFRWCLATEPQRWERRLETSLDDMQVFYDACFPRVEEAIRYCDGFPLHDMPADAERLLQLLCSFALVSYPIEVWRQARVPDSGAASMDVVVEPAV